MTLHVGSTVIAVTDIVRAEAFWSAALGYVRRSPELDSPTFVALTDPEREWSNVSLQASLEIKTKPNRLHLDLYADDAKAEVRRLVGLGAQVVRRPDSPHADYVMMTDPDGNEFCVVQH